LAGEILKVLIGAVVAQVAAVLLIVYHHVLKE